MYIMPIGIISLGLIYNRVRLIFYFLLVYPCLGFKKLYNPREGSPFLQFRDGVTFVDVVLIDVLLGFVL